MKILLSSQNLELLSAVQQRLEKKLQTLERFTRKFGPEVVLEVLLVRDTKHHERGNIYSAQAKLKIPGKDIFYEAEGTTLEEAVDKLKDNLKRLLIENKEKKESVWKKIAKIAKRE
ncbi:MAG: HPF/RaiA family ribosome-associated protein [Patescibacteria group bacterium]|nr:HPF/RaiA family ribosome-associated protein [Patescibacteria group bacterium]